MKPNILIAEASADVARVVALGARVFWPECAITAVTSGSAALEQIAGGEPDLVVLSDVTVPPDGLELCRGIREQSGVPILMLSAHSTTLDKVRALDLGADDYMTRPFDEVELLARMRALLRRACGQPTAARGTVAVHELTINYVTREVRVGNRSVDLTSTEYRLLELLVQNAGEALPHQAILGQVWGPAYCNDTHYLKVFVRRLRQKLGDSARRPRYIQTEWGVGYRFVPPG